MQDNDYSRAAGAGAAHGADASRGGDASGDGIQRGRSRRRAAPAKKTASAGMIRLRRILILCVLEVFVMAGLFAYRSVLKQYSRIQRPDFEVKNVENQELSSEDIQRMKGYWNIAAFGVDSRDSSVGRGNNSDVIIIVSINRENGEIRLSSVFRDSYLSLSNGSCNKINQAYAIGGPEQAVRALNQNLDLNITDYVTFNWKAVATAVDILGGVDIEISNAEFKYINSYITETVKGTGIGSVHLKNPGLNHLDGVQAVAYARLRYMDNDYTRTERQRRVIQLCYEKAKQADMQTLSDLAGNMLSMVATSLTWEDGMNLAKNVRKYRIAETLGFPMDRREVVMGKKGACVLPNTLITNVQTLHTFLFGDNGYEVSRQVKEIDYKISADEANYKNAAAESKARQLEKQKEEEEKRKKKEQESETDEDGKPLETDEDGNVIRETDADGKPVRHVRETDEDGNPILETDEDGNPIEETDEDGNPVLETDENGDPVRRTRSVRPDGAPGDPELDYDESDADDSEILNIYPGGTRPGDEDRPGGRTGLHPSETLPASEEGEEEEDEDRPTTPGGWAAPGVRNTESGSRSGSGTLRPSAPGETTDDYVADGPGHSGSSTSGTTESLRPDSPTTSRTQSSERETTKSSESSRTPETTKSSETTAASPSPVSPSPVSTTHAETTAASPSPVSPVSETTAASGGPGGASSETVAPMPGA